MEQAYSDPATTKTRNYGITPIPKTKPACIDAILQHLKENNQPQEVSDTEPQDVIGEAQSPGQSAQVFTENTSHNNASSQFQMPNTSYTTDLPQFCAMMKESMQMQQEMINNLVRALTISQRPPQVHSQHETAATSSREMNHQERFSWMTSNAVKFLSSQIPYFNGTEDEVECWIKKIETVAELHSLSSVVKLTAASSKLSKTVRRWFDLSIGPINESWDSFKEEIVDRFRRKVLFSEVIQKVDARKWIFSKESFQEYAIDKLALMKNLKLSDEDSIQHLIKGIGSYALRATAAALRTNSLNPFLREMQHITSTSGDLVNKSPTSADLVS